MVRRPRHVDEEWFPVRYNPEEGSARHDAVHLIAAALGTLSRLRGAAVDSGVLGDARSIALEVDVLEAVRPFYETDLDLSPVEDNDGTVAYDAGSCRIELREVGALPRGGAHVHYALSVAPDAYDDWYARLDANHDLEERSFGGARSLYCYDPAGHCVELAERGDGPGISGLFEVVLEVEDLEAAVDRFQALGFSVVDRSDEEDRVRLATGAVDLELWLPRRGIAGARGGVHVDWTLAADNPHETVDGVDPDQWRVCDRNEDSVTLRDWDGHRLTLTRAD